MKSNVEWMRRWNQGTVDQMNADLKNSLLEGNTWGAFTMYSSRLGITLAILIQYN